MKSYKKTRKKKLIRNHFSKIWIFFICIVILLVLVSLFSPTSSQVKGVSTGQLVKTDSSLTSSISSFFSGIFKKTTKSKTSQTQSITSSITSGVLDLTRLTLGDNKYTASPHIGYVYSCEAMNSQGKSSNSGGANKAGPWINQTAKTWDLTKKYIVDGSVSWSNATWSVNSSGAVRTLAGNGLPTYHTTGVYPIAATDDAVQYDRNPNSISAQTISLSLPTNPTLLSSPQCVSGEVGIMLSGVPLFNAFDAGLRDANAWEIQDSCDGHPQQNGQYHYHGYSDCLKDSTTSSAHSSLIGYAFDGFGIYGLKGENGTELKTADLDECHGHTHLISWDGVTKNMYHYHMTRDFPYSVSCFRGKSTIKQAASGSQSGSTTKSGKQGKMQARPSGMPGGQEKPPLGQPMQ